MKKKNFENLFTYKINLCVKQTQTQRVINHQIRMDDIGLRNISNSNLHNNVFVKNYAYIKFEF